MADLHRPILKIDDRSRVAAGGGTPPIESGGGGSAPNVVTPPPPRDLTVVSTALAQSAVTPTAIATLRWTPPPTTPVASYQIAWSTSPATNADGDFVTLGGTENPDGNQTETTVGALPCGVTVYFQARTIARGGLYGRWGVQVSALTPADTTAPAPPTDVTAAFAADGTLEVRATPPASPNYRLMRVRVLNAAGTTEWDVGEFVTGMWPWPPARNRLRTAGQWARSVRVEVRAVSWGGISSAPVVVTATMAPPAAPAGLTTSWQADDGTAAADCLISWTPIAGLTYILVVDTGLAERIVIGGASVYGFAQNAQDHAGTADNTLSIALYAQDGLEQRSPAATLAATNAAPPAAAITAATGYNATASLILTASTARDLRDYEIEVRRDGVAVRTFRTSALLQTYEIQDGGGSYTFRARAVDVFGSPGAWSTTTAAIVLDPLTIATLREDVIYTDSVATASTVLKAALADNVL